MGYINFLKIISKKLDLFDLVQPETQKSLLHLSIEHNQTEVAEFLVNSESSLSKTDSRGLTPLHEAAIWGNDTVANLLIKKQVNLEARDSFKKTPLQFASKTGREHIVQHLIDHGVDVNSADEFGNTPMHRAASTGQIKVLKLLKDGNACVNILNDKNETPLHRASQSHDLEILETVTWLVENDAEVNCKDRTGRTPLYFAAQNGCDAIVLYLLQQGADCFAKNDFDDTAKNIAHGKGHQSIVKILEENEKKVSNSSYSPYSNHKLFHAAATGDFETVKSLSQSGANLKETTKSGETVLHIAAEYGHADIVAFLLTQGAETSAKSKEKHRVPLHLASQSGHVKVVQLLLNKGENNAADKWGWTPLHQAAYGGHQDVVKELVDAGVDIHIPGKEGDTPLHSAAGRGNHKIVEYLLAKGARAEKQAARGYTCLHVAIRSGNKETVSYLIEKRKDIIDMVDNKGRTALHWAAEQGSEEMVKLLVGAGANTEIEDSFKKTALHLVPKKFVGIAAYLSSERDL